LLNELQETYAGSRNFELQNFLSVEQDNRQSKTSELLQHEKLTYIP
jgi:hypothetical protein